MPETSFPTSTRLSATSSAEEANEVDRLRLPAGSVAAPLSALAFWIAIALPALYLPLLFTGLTTVPDLLTFFGLFGLHLVALVGGRSYGRD